LALTPDLVSTTDLAAERLRLAQELLGYRFKRPGLLAEALTHRSATQGRLKRRGTGSNERLEFLGDRVLGLLIAEWLIERFPDEQEGKLGLRFADLVSREALSDIGTTIGYAKAVTLGAASAATEAAGANVLADAMEAALAALYLDGGLDEARLFVRRAWEQRVSGQILPPEDAKTTLQMWLQGRGKPLPVYTVVSTEGPSHAPKFVISVSGAGRNGVGEAGTKRAAERAAAAALLAQLLSPDRSSTPNRSNPLERPAPNEHAKHTEHSK
jgi:ribonuclease-3